METTGTAVARIQDTGAAVVRKTTGHHGEVRGLNLSRRSSQFEGRFGRMFRTLPAAQFDEQMLRKLADAMSFIVRQSFTTLRQEKKAGHWGSGPRMEGEGTLVRSYLYPVCGRLKAHRHRVRT